MKTAISTLPFKEWGLDETIEACKSAGYDAMEVRMNIHSWSDPALSDEHFKEMRKKINDAGMRVIDMGSSVVAKDYQEENVVAMKRLLEVAEILGADGIRIMLGYSRNLWSQPQQETDVDAIHRYVQEIDDMATACGKQIWIETHNDYATGRALKTVYDATDLKSTKIIWDIMHPLEQNESLAETIEYVGEHIAHVHIKDGLPWENNPDKMIWKYTKIGEGIVPITEVMKILKDMNYDGYYSLEWESSWREEIRELNCDPEQISAYPSYMQKLAESV